MYTAIHYVRIGGRLYTPGEIINEAMEPQVVERLVRKGAIRPEAGEVDAMPAQTAQEGKEAAFEPEPEEVGEEDEDAAQSQLMGNLVKSSGRRKRR